MELLKDLIKKNLGNYEAEYAIGKIEGVSNHLPMSLISLAKIGASDSCLERFYNWYVPRLNKRNIEEKNIGTADNLQQYLGRHTNNHSLFLFFRGELENIGRDQICRRYLPILMPGVAAGAFHPLIRLAFGMEIDDDDEICEALASWVMGYLPLSIPDEKPRNEVGAIIANLNEASIDPGQFKAPSIFERVKNVGDSDIFQVKVSRPLQPSIKDIADIAIRAYLAKPSFAVLHLVTATHALRVVCERYGDISKSIDHFWTAFCATYVSEGSPNPNTPSPDVELLEWSELKHIATDSLDDHTCKFVYACLEEESAYSSKNYQLAASLRCKK